MACCVSLSELMNGRSSSNKNRTETSSVKAVWTDMRSKYSADLSSYTSACQKDSNLKSFDSTLHQRTNVIITSLAARAETQSLSLDSLMEVYGFLLELNQDAVRVIIESREDVWKNKGLKSLVDVFFKSTSKTLDFCNAVEKCVKRTKISQLIIRLAVKQFETESLETDLGGNKRKKYTKTLEELNKFKAMGDPFEGEFVNQYEQQVSLLEELRKLKVKLAKKQRRGKTWRKLSNVVFATAFVSVLVVSVVTASINGSQVVGAVAGALTSPIEFVGNWFSQLLKKYEKAVKRDRGLVLSMETHAKVNNAAMEKIRAEVDKLRIMISLILETVEFAVEIEEEEVEEATTSDAMQVIKKNVDEFTEKIEEVGENAEKCSKFIGLGRFLVLEHILRLQPADLES